MLFIENKTELFFVTTPLFKPFYIDIIISLVYYNYSNGTAWAVLLIGYFIFYNRLVWQYRAVIFLHLLCKP